MTRTTGLRRVRGVCVTLQLGHDVIECANPVVDIGAHALQSDVHAARGLLAGQLPYETMSETLHSILSKVLTTPIVLSTNRANVAQVALVPGPADPVPPAELAFQSNNGSIT